MANKRKSVDDVPHWTEEGDSIGVHTLYFDWSLELSEGHVEFLTLLINRDTELRKEFDDYMNKHHGKAWWALFNNKEFQKFLEDS